MAQTDGVVYTLFFTKNAALPPPLNDSEPAKSYAAVGAESAVVLS